METALGTIGVIKIACYLLEIRRIGIRNEIQTLYSIWILAHQLSPENPIFPFLRSGPILANVVGAPQRDENVFSWVEYTTAGS